MRVMMVKDLPEWPENGEIDDEGPPNIKALTKCSIETCLHASMLLKGSFEHFGLSRTIIQKIMRAKKVKKRFDHARGVVKLRTQVPRSKRKIDDVRWGAAFEAPSLPWHPHATLLEDTRLSQDHSIFSLQMDTHTWISLPMVSSVEPGWLSWERMRLLGRDYSLSEKWSVDFSIRFKP